MTPCLRKPLTEAVARAKGVDKGYFRCQWCGDWHTGTDPGPVPPCWRCGTLITIPDRGTPQDAARGWLHDATRCKAA